MRSEPSIILSSLVSLRCSIYLCQRTTIIRVKSFFSSLKKGCNSYYLVPLTKVIKFSLNLNVRAFSITKAILEEGTTPLYFSKCLRRRGGGGSCTLHCPNKTTNLIIKTVIKMGTVTPALMVIPLVLGKTLRNTISSGLNGRSCVTSNI